jgi:hypothetical protein
MPLFDDGQATGQRGCRGDIAAKSCVPEPLASVESASRQSGSGCGRPPSCHEVRWVGAGMRLGTGHAVTQAHMRRWGSSGTDAYVHRWYGTRVVVASGPRPKAPNVLT